ncbi:MAG: hypothetical protein CVU65_03170 [Deltaproteobacteria bacterium HGW-Deltaproteobacteria-22]|nr:MAG: hypothetical protein CVU65_03170 [Deltaproteobacteria bacterium HGW-Deltaproteobacteria-22]
MSLMTAKQYGNYELVERIARGGMAEVFKARMKGAAGFEKLVALKMLHSHLAEDADMVASLKDEARLVSNMLHPNICQVLYFEQIGETYCITMEYIHGKDVSTMMRALRKSNQKLPLEFALFIIRQTLTGLDYAHRMVDSSNNPLNIIHRDISPQNILVSYSGAVKIIDFGIAKAAEGLHHTQDGVIKGKFRYMAPEQAMGLAIDHRVDIFAAGVVLYELLLGETHSKGATDAELIVKAQSGAFEPIERQVPNLPRDLAEVVKKALMKDPSERFPSARLFRTALDGIVKREGLEVAPEAMASYLNNMFPDVYSRGSRVDEIEQLAGDILELSPLPETGQMQAMPRGPGFAAGSGPMPAAFPQLSARPAPLPAHLAPPPTMDFSSPPPPPPAAAGPVPPAPAPLPEAHPVGLTKATSEKARERRKRERDQKKEEQVRVDKENETMRVNAKAAAKALPRVKRPSVVWPFVDRLGKAFVNTLVNIFLGVLVIAIGAGILYFTRSEEAQEKKESKRTPIADPAKDCKRGPVELTLVSDPSDAEVWLDGEKMDLPSPWHNVKTDMCYNVPLAIRMVKGDLSYEQKVDYPVEGGRITLSVKLEKGGNMSVEPDSTGTGAGTGTGSGGTYRPSGSGITGSGMRPAQDPPPQDAPPADGPVDLAGGVGVLKITCSAPCTILIAGKNKGSEKVFRLRARKDPYAIQADFGSGVLSEIKKVYIFPNQDNFAHFSHP